MCRYSYNFAKSFWHLSKYTIIILRNDGLRLRTMTKLKNKILILTFMILAN